MVQLLWKTVWQLLKKLNIEFLFDPAIPLLCKVYLLFFIVFLPLPFTFLGKILLLGMYPKELKARTQGNICTYRFTAAFFTTARKWKQVSDDR